MKHSIRHYHRLTAYDRNNMAPHRMDWTAQPQPFKAYPDMPVTTLPEVTGLYSEHFRDVLSGKTGASSDQPPDLEQLSRILYLSNGMTARARQQNGYFYYRSPPSAGALYPNELYLAWFGSDDLKAGLYHSEAYQRRLTRLREGDCSSFLQNAANSASGVFLVSGIFFRSAWKYRKRAYRYVLLDGGHLIESTRLALAAAGCPGTVFYDFDDDLYNRLLGVDAQREACVAGIRIAGRRVIPASSSVTVIPDLPPTVARASLVSGREITYTEIIEAHRAGHMTVPSPSPADISDISAADLGLSPENRQPFNLFVTEGHDPIQLDYSETVLNRRSRRNFIPTSISAAQFSCLLEMICRANLSGEQESRVASTTVQTGFLCRNVDGFTPGFYLLDPSGRNIDRITGTDLIPAMTAACLDQEWLKNAAIHFLFLTCLDKIDRHCGARGYRYAMLTTGRLGHVVYLAATSMGLGCCGIGAFYDREAEQLLGLNENSTLLYLVAAGVIR